jgi:hypothetical protein
MKDYTPRFTCIIMQVPGSSDAIFHMIMQVAKASRLPRIHPWAFAFAGAVGPIDCAPDRKSL